MRARKFLLQNLVTDRYSSATAALIRLCNCGADVDVAIAMTPIHSCQLADSLIAVLLALPSTRHTSRRARLRDSGVVISKSFNMATTRWPLPSARRSSSRAMATSTSAWKSAWFSQMRPMTEALVTRRPVMDSTRSNTCLNVRLLGAASIPSCWTTSSPACNRRSCNSPRGCRFLPFWPFEARTVPSPLAIRPPTSCSNPVLYPVECPLYARFQAGTGRWSQPTPVRMGCNVCRRSRPPPAGFGCELDANPPISAVTRLCSVARVTRDLSRIRGHG